MKFIADTSGRFGQRPYYNQTELDWECESVITQFMTELYGKLLLPIPSDALTKLIERDADDLDLYSDLEGEGVEVEGVTEIFPDQKPRVRISSRTFAQVER